MRICKPAKRQQNFMLTLWHLDSRGSPQPRIGTVHKNFSALWRRADPHPACFCHSRNLFQFVGVSDIVDYPDSRGHFVQMIQQLAVFARSQLPGNGQRVPGHLHFHLVRKRKARQFRS